MAELALALFLLAAPLQAAGQEGTVSGTLTLNGRVVPLSHVYASAESGFFDKSKEDIRVLMSDAPLSDDARRDVFALMKLAREGQATIIEVVIDTDGQPISGMFLAKEWEGMVSATGMHIFTKPEMGRTNVAGRLGTSGDHRFQEVTYAYNAEFSAPIPRALTPEELTPSLATPAAIGASAYVSAVRAGELSAFLSTMTATAADDFRGADGAVLLQQLRADMPADGRVVLLIPQVNGTVLAKVEGRDNGIVIGYTLKMALDDGAWKVAK